MTYDELFRFVEEVESLRSFHYEHIFSMKKMPASLKGHHSYCGGYYDHILEVMNFCYSMYTSFPVCDVGFSLSDLLLSAYIHDLDKLLYRYELSDDPPTEKQVNYARSIGCELSENETKSSISERITAKKENREFDNDKINPFKSRSDGMWQEDSGIVMHLAYENGIKGINPNIVHAVSFHHGGFNPYATVNQNITLMPIAKMLHCADMLSTIQNGKQ